MVMTPLVSIIVNNYNYGRYLGQAIESALAQTHQPTEVIVVDDGSTDDSREVIARYSDRVTPVLKDNGGQASAFNAGFEQSRGDIICFLDADDVLLTFALERAVEAFQGNVVQAQWPMFETNAAGERTGQIIPGHEQLEGELRDLTIAEGPVVEITPTSGSAWHRPFLDEIFPVPEGKYKICADIYLGTLAPVVGRVKRLSEPLSEYRYHGANHYRGTSLATKVRRDLDNYEQRCEILKTHLTSLDIAFEERRWKGEEAAYCSWLRRTDRSLRKVMAVLPEHVTYILIEDNQWGSGAILEGRVAVPLLEREGLYWGAPPSDEVGIHELYRLRRAGARYLVLAWPAFWWLEHYPALWRDVRCTYPCLHEDADVIIYSLDV